jgi:hypothetical protein
MPHHVRLSALAAALALGALPAARALPYEGVPAITANQVSFSTAAARSAARPARTGTGADNSPASTPKASAPTSSGSMALGLAMLALSGRRLWRRGGHGAHGG